LYADQNQINALVPYELALGNTSFTIETNGVKLGPWPAEIAPVVPGLFTFASDAPFGTNVRIAAAVNEDGTLNSWRHPARSGSIVALYGTGFGALTNDRPLRRLQRNLQAYGPGGAGGGMEIVYAGEAPGLEGVQQVNVRIGPRPASNIPVAISIRLFFDLATVNGEYTQDNVAIFVQ
jgi:uncharacterized protein (TIGR03437 family)